MIFWDSDKKEYIPASLSKTTNNVVDIDINLQIIYNFCLDVLR